MSDLSDNRITALARSALRAIAAEGKIVNERGALIESKRILSSYFQQGDAIDGGSAAKDSFPVEKSHPRKYGMGYSVSSVFRGRVPKAKILSADG